MIERSLQIQPLSHADEAFLWEAIYHAIFVPSGQSPPPRSIVDDPNVARYVNGWGRAGDLGFAAEIAGRRMGACWIRLWSGRDRGYGYVHDDIPDVIDGDTFGVGLSGVDGNKEIHVACSSVVLCCRFPGSLPGDDLTVGNIAAENVEGAADGQIDPPLAETVDPLKIGQRSCPSRIGDGNWRMRSQQFDQVFFDAGAFAFHVDAVDQKLVAIVRQPCQGGAVDALFGPLLPTVGDDPEIVAAPATTQVEHQTFAPDGAHQRRQTVQVDASGTKDI